MAASKALPIWEIHRGIVSTLESGNRLVLVAPTGSGKTTQVPQMVLDAGLAGRKRVVVLQPRRVAARSVAARVAWERQVLLGGEVGYQIRFDDQSGSGTRICFVTEGILLRWLQDDPQLGSVGILIFDEFHERNLLSDVALALAKQLQQTARPDLKVVVMSATLDAEPVAKYLDNAPVLVSEGQSHPVEVEYLTHPDRRPVTEQAADAVERIVATGSPGDVLVFMPGMGEINATLNALRAARTGEKLELIPLHGDLAPEEQDRAFAASPHRKVVVATNVAETSITIDGIRHVVDSGQARVARYDAERGINTLFFEEVSRASADQRKGRAGRTAPGTCHRLWTESGHLNRPERNTPEIQRSDLAEVVLLLHSLGIRRAATFDWLDRPDPQAVERAEQLLVTLGALRRSTGEGTDLTEIGRQMLRLPMHPRYARMLVEAKRHQCVPAAALCAALVSGRDLLMRVGREDKHLADARELFEGSGQSDFFTLIRAYQFARKANFSVEQCKRYGIHGQTARQVEQTHDQILQIAERHGFLPQGGTESKGGDGKPDDGLQRSIVAGFIDQLAVRRDQGSLECELVGGRQGTLMRESVVQQAPLLVTAAIREVEGRGYGTLTLLGLATAVKREWLEELYPDQLRVEVEHLFDRGHRRVAAIKLTRFQDLVIQHDHQREVDPEASGRCLADAFAKGWFELPNLTHDLKQFIARVNLVHVAMPDLEFPAFDEAALVRALSRSFAGMTLAKEAQAANLKPGVHAHLASGQVGWLDELTPATLPWTDGRRLKLAYSEEADLQKGAAISPEVQVKLTDCFGLTEHPLICEGLVPVKFWLCGPDGKRIDSTCNWPSWKATQYPKLRSALQKKYPGVGWL